MRNLIRRLTARVSTWLDAGWDDYDKPTYVDDTDAVRERGRHRWPR